VTYLVCHIKSRDLVRVMFVAEQDGKQYCNYQCIDGKAEPDLVPVFGTIGEYEIFVNNDTGTVAAQDSAKAIGHHHK